MKIVYEIVWSGWKVAWFQRQPWTYDFLFNCFDWNLCRCWWDSRRKPDNSKLTLCLAVECSDTRIQREAGTVATVATAAISMWSRWIRRTVAVGCLLEIEMVSRFEFRLLVFLHLNRLEFESLRIWNAPNPNRSDSKRLIYISCSDFTPSGGSSTYAGTFKRKRALNSSSHRQKIKPAYNLNRINHL